MGLAKDYSSSVGCSPVSPLSPASSAPSTPCKFVHVDPATFEALSRSTRGSSMQHTCGVRSVSGPLPRNVEYIQEVQRQAMSGPLFPQQSKQKNSYYSGVLRDHLNKNALNISKPLVRTGSMPLPLPPSTTSTSDCAILNEKKVQDVGPSSPKSCTQPSCSTNPVQSPVPLPLPTSSTHPGMTSDRRTRSLETCTPSFSDSDFHSPRPDEPTTPRPSTSQTSPVAYKLPPPPLSFKPSVPSIPERVPSRRLKSAHEGSTLPRKPKLGVAN